MADIEQLARYLKHTDRAKRAQAIKALGKSGDARAMKLLSWSIKNDPDPQVKQYARKAYTHLKQKHDAPLEQTDETGTLGAASLLAYSKRKNQEVNTSQPGNPGDDTFDFGYVDEDDVYAEDEDAGPGYLDDDDTLFAFDEAEDGGTSDPGRTGPIDWEARKAIRAAMEFHIDGEDTKALMKLLDAIKIDSRSTREAEALNVAAAITDMDGQAAMEAIQDPDFQRSFINLSDRRRREIGDDDPDWGTTWMDIGIYGLVLTVGIVAIALIAGVRFEALFDDYVNNPGRYDVFVKQFGLQDNDMTDADFTDLGRILQGSVPFIILGGIFVSIITIIMNMIQFFAIHFAAVNFFKGQKPSSVTIDKLFTTTTVILGGWYVVVLVAMFLLPNQPEVYATAAGVSNAENILNTSDLATSIVTFVGGVWQIYVLGRAQQIGYVSGCLSVWIGFFLLVGMFCGCLFAFTFLAGTINLFG